MLDLNQVHLMDCDQGMALLEEASVDLIFTDPPYIKEVWEEAYTTLAKHSARILKPSGFLIMYSGHYNLDKVIHIFQDSGLEYFWIVSQLNTMAKAIVRSRNAMASFKPILIYQKPPIRACPMIFMDVVAGKRSKKYHPWEQSIHEALFLISRFARPGDLVLDPFTGSGTSLLAAKLVGMNYIGFEIEEGTIEIARMRLSQEPLDLASFGEVVA